jgi:hypothetical protein
MSHYNTVFNELLKLVPRHEFENAVYKHNGDYRIRKMSCWNHFATLLYAQISGKDSLRDIETGINAQAPKLYHLGMREVRRSTLSDANNNRPHEIYEQIFGKTLNRVYGVTTKHKFKFSNPLFTLDATTIDLCLEVFPWAKFRKTKGAIKMHTLFNNSGYFPSVVVVTDGKVHDSKIAKELPSDALQADSIVLVDKAYIDFSWLYDLALNKCYFVTRAKDNMDYASIGQHNEACPAKGLIADKIIELKGFYTSQKYPKRLRLVIYKDQETGKTYEFLTNNFILSPFTIAKLYKERWQVELFYKWIKQNLKIKSFFGNTKNAVMSQIWAAMVYYLLLCYIKFQSRYSNTLLYLSRIIKETLMERVGLIDLLKLKVENIAKIKNTIQLCLEF